MSKMRVEIEVELSNNSGESEKLLLQDDLFREIRNFFLNNYYTKEIVQIKRLLITSNSGRTYYENHEATTATSKTREEEF
jgi:hypothetical protein